MMITHLQTMQSRRWTKKSKHEKIYVNTLNVVCVLELLHPPFLSFVLFISFYLFHNLWWCWTVVDRFFSALKWMQINFCTPQSLLGIYEKPFTWLGWIRKLHSFYFIWPERWNWKQLENGSNWNLAMVLLLFCGGCVCTQTRTIFSPIHPYQYIMYTNTLAHW